MQQNDFSTENGLMYTLYTLRLNNCIILCAQRNYESYKKIIKNKEKINIQCYINY